MSGVYQRARQYSKWTKQILEQSKSSLSPKLLSEYVAWTKHQLHWLARIQSVLGQRKVVRLKLQKHISTEKAAVKLANFIVQGKPRPLVFIGSTKIASFIRGYVRVPQRKIVNHLASRCDLRFTDEFRSTKLCSRCFDVCKTSKSPHRY